MRISLLYDQFKGQDIYVVGNGPSLRYYPLHFFSERLTIGLNRTWRTVATKFSLTCHPELLIEYEKWEGPKPETQWIVKAFKPPARLTLEDKRYYIFRSGSPTDGHNLDFVRYRSPEEYLYQGRGIHQTAMNLAAHMGARAIFLCGVDMADLFGDHHSVEQPVRFLGLNPESVYKEYRDFTDHVRQVIRDELGIPVISMSPFLGLGAAEEDASRLRKQLRLEPLKPGKDDSRYRRDKVDKPS